jgi:hypothetical protein
MAQKIFIFLEFTRDEKMTQELIEALKVSNQIDASNELKRYISKPRKEYLENVYEVCKKVILSDSFLEALKQHSLNGYIKEMMV